MDALFIALTLTLVLLVVVGIVAIELGVRSRPGLAGSTPED